MRRGRVWTGSIIFTWQKIASLPARSANVLKLTDLGNTSRTRQVSRERVKFKILPQEPSLERNNRERLSDRFLKLLVHLSVRVNR